MTKANHPISDSEPGDTDRRTRLIGAYLLYVAGLLVVVGVAFGVLIYLLSPMAGANIAQPDVDESTQFMRTSMGASAVVIGIGVIVAAIGLYRFRNPVKV